MTDMLAFASWLVHDRGCSVIPIAEKDKKPTLRWTPYQQSPPSDAELQTWFGNGRNHNLGLVTGAVSGVVVVDGDSAEALDWMGAHLPATPMRTGTSKGEHWFYRHPGGQVGTKAGLDTGDPKVKVDLRADGGYVVAPPSVHPSGVVYRKLGDWPPIAELPTFDPAWLGSAAARAHEPAPLPTTVATGSRNSILLSLLDRRLRLATTLGLERRQRRVPSVEDYVREKAER